MFSPETVKYPFVGTVLGLHTGLSMTFQFNSVPVLPVQGQSALGSAYSWQLNRSEKTSF